MTNFKGVFDFDNYKDHNNFKNKLIELLKTEFDVTESSKEYPEGNCKLRCVIKSKETVLNQ